MKIRKISADYVFPVISKPVKNGVLTVDETGRILNIQAYDDSRKTGDDVEKYNGILVPGFINAHCHSELAHLKNAVDEHTGLPEFVCQIVAKRAGIVIGDAIFKADEEMYAEGIVAVGDITNGMDSVEMKRQSRIYYHSFIEVLAFDEEDAEITMQNALQLKNSINQLGLSATITPHAPYSVSAKLFDLIAQHETVASIHNQETEAEAELFISKTGELTGFVPLFSKKFDAWQAVGKNSLHALLPQYSAFKKLILIHNTSSDATDIDTICEKVNDTAFVLCPRSNLYIENRLPNFQMFRDKKVRIALGTDSPASNHGLSILEEMKTVQKNAPNIPFAEILTWATLNGAHTLDKTATLGSFEIGKQPGVNLIKSFDCNNMKLREESSVQRII